MENHFLSRNRLLVILTLKCDAQNKGIFIHAGFQKINFGASFLRSYETIYSTRQEETKKEDMRFRAQDSVQGPNTFLRGRWGKATQDNSGEQAWRTTVHISQRVPGEMWLRDKWRWEATCPICELVRFRKWTSDRIVKAKQNETRQFLTPEQSKKLYK